MLTAPHRLGKALHSGFVMLSLFTLTACSTNPATGQSQFTALMSPQQEVQVGAQEHNKIIKQMGLYPNQELQSYVRQVGEKVARDTERPEVQYKFHLLDSPIVNAFALPGGYVYLTRGLLALANSEDEMASVLAHETAHITARHSAERYSRGVVTSLGAAIIASAVGSSGVSEALGVGSNLYMKSYSRGQEGQADALGIRYLNRAGYDPFAMGSFLRNLQADSALEAHMMGKKSAAGTNYFSTHPATAERVNKANEESRQYKQKSIVHRDAYLKKINNMTYGDSAEQGFVRGRNFYHTGLGFQFTVPQGFNIINQPSNVVAASRSGAVMIFDMAANKRNLSPMKFLRSVWMQGEPVSGAENITINGMRAATATFPGTVNGKAMNIRVVAMRWSAERFARFQIAIPRNSSQETVDGLKRATYSFQRMSAQQKKQLKPYRIKIVKARSGDTVPSIAARMAFDDYKEMRFRVLNGMSAQDSIVSGRRYKIVSP